MKASTQFGPRVRFAWGYQAAAWDFQCRRPKRRPGPHLFALNPKACGKAYIEGYEAGWEDSQQGIYAGDPSESWERLEKDAEEQAMRGIRYRFNKENPL